MEILRYEFGGEGLGRVYENEKWMVGIKNWKPANDVSGIDCLERHNETDELFILLSGSCTLLEAEERAGSLELRALRMEPGKVYEVPRSHWHNTVTSRDVKLILVEDVSTGSANSDILRLDAEQVAAARRLAGGA